MEHEPKKAMAMPELLVFARAFAIGIVIAEVLRLTFNSTDKFALLISEIDWYWRAIAVGLAIGICSLYVIAREGWNQGCLLAKSRRFDLLAMLLIGVWANELVAPWLDGFHKFFDAANGWWAPTLLAILLLTMTSALWRAYFPRKKEPLPQLYFATDDEIDSLDEDVLSANTQAHRFAEIVLASGSHQGLVFGVDGPWGTGKTSFLNLAKNYWEKEAPDKVIVFRFEPLRYATDPDLVDRLVRDLTAMIQRQVYVPEFRPAASRYSRMLKGKADFSFLGLKLSLEPSSETLDELLEDIDDVLERIKRRLIVIIDDLDRLDAKAVNTVLFTVRKTFKLTRAAYILCYDTENLISAKDEGEKAREFLEKFVNVKLSLFVDSSAVRHFLMTDWRKEEAKYQAMPSDTMAKLSSVLSEVSNMLGDDKAANYTPLLGDLRKVKRFVNAALLIQLEKTDLAKTDFNRRDLVNLVLLHLHFPGIFRRIYSEETEGRSGTFAVQRDYEKDRTAFVNAAGWPRVLEECKSETARFLLHELFDAETVDLPDFGNPDESVLASRACFNSDSHRNLESYLKLIVRFASPEPRETFKLYQEAVDSVVSGHKTIEALLSTAEFSLRDGEHAHDQFWRILLSHSYDFTDKVAEDAIESLVSHLPRYSSIDVEGRGLRPRSAYSLVRLLDRAGWGRTSGKRLPNTSKNIVEVAHRILGDQKYQGKSLIDQLTAQNRGTIGWSDLMLFRLQSSADRGGQNFNLQNALIVRDDPDAPTTGLVTSLALRGMRTFSQHVFARFQDVYIKPKRNFLAEVDQTEDEQYLGDCAEYITGLCGDTDTGRERLVGLILGARSENKAFVVFQLANRKPPNDSGVGCGFYDPSGLGDGGGIGVLMNEYLFDVCFNPAIDIANTLHFADYCLCKLTSSFFSDSDEDGHVPTRQSLTSELDSLALMSYWALHGSTIREHCLGFLERRVVTRSYVATYRDDLPRVFKVLDEISAGFIPDSPSSSAGEGTNGIVKSE